MPNPVWPPTVPQHFLEGVNESPKDIAVRSAVDTGLPRVRRRATAPVLEYRGQINCTKTQKDVIRDFWRDACKGGAQKFDWYDPGTVTTTAFRFVSPPQADHQGADRWRVTLTLERLP